MCCNGSLHARVAVRVQHVPLVRKLGLKLETLDEKRATFPLPCSLFKNDCCSVYPDHPPSCQTYKCALLLKYEAGGATIDEGLAIVRAAKGLLEGWSERIAQGNLWDRVRAELKESPDTLDAGQRRERADLSLRAGSLRILLKNHFWKPEDGDRG